MRSCPISSAGAGLLIAGLLPFLAGCGDTSAPPSAASVERNLVREGYSLAPRRPASATATPAPSAAATEAVEAGPAIRVERTGTPEPLTPVVTTAPAADTAPAAVGELSRLPGWRVAKWGSPATLDVGTPDQGLRIRIPPETPPQEGAKVAIELPVTAEGQITTGETKGLRVTARGNVPGAMVAVAIEAAGQYFESRPVGLEPDWQEMTFPFNRADWKTAATGWRHETTVATGDVGKVIVLIYQPQPGLEVALRGLQVLETR